MTIRPNEFRDAALRHLQPLVAGEWTPGLVAGLSLRGERTFVGLGQRGLDLEAPAPDEHTLYETGSVGKVFTALLAVEAARRGELDLDRPLGEIAGLPLVPDGPAAALRPWQLAAHVSGLPREPDDLDFGVANPYTSYTSERLWAFLERWRPARAAGADYEYSNVGAGLLGHVLEHVGRADYATLVRERIALPLELTDTAAVLDAAQLERLAAPTLFGMPGEVWGADDALAAAGCLRSSAADTLRFAELALHPPEDVPVAASLRELEGVRHHFEDESEGGVALGWHVLADGTHWHNGSTGGYHAFVAFDRTCDAALAVLANDVCPEVTEAAHALFDDLRARDHTVDPIELPPLARVGAPQLDALVGRYVDAAEGVGLDVTRAGTRLFAQVDDQLTLRVFAESRTRFRYRAIDAVLAFEIGGDGRATAVTVEQAGGEWRLERSTTA